MNKAANSEDAESQGEMLSGLRLVSLLTLGSRVTGLIRDSGMAALFGNGPIMDAFTVAFRIPNLARRLFGEGALTAAFLPALVREIEQKGRDSAWRLASALFVVLAAVLCGIVVVAEVGLFVAGSLSDSPDTQLLIGLAAVMVPYLIFICLAAQVGAVMHSMNHFKWPAIISVLLNLVWIVGIFVVAPMFDTATAKIYAIGVVVVVGGVMQFAVPLPRCLGWGLSSIVRVWGVRILIELKRSPVCVRSRRPCCRCCWVFRSRSSIRFWIALLRGGLRTRLMVS